MLKQNRQLLTCFKVILLLYQFVWLKQKYLISLVFYLLSLLLLVINLTEPAEFSRLEKSKDLDEENSQLLLVFFAEEIQRLIYIGFRFLILDLAFKLLEPLIFLYLIYLQYSYKIYQRRLQRVRSIMLVIYIIYIKLLVQLDR